jgi:hypothetical protein
MTLGSTRKARIRTIRSRIDALNKTAARTWCEFGSLFAEVKREELWRDDGADTFFDWLGTIGWERESARKAMLVAANFTPEMAETYGTEKLVAAVGYLEATRREEKPGELAALQVRYPGEDGRFATVPFPKATVAQVKAATKLVTQARPEKDRPEAVARYDQAVALLVDAMPAAPAGLGKGKRVAVEVGTDGRPAVTFHAIPVDELEAFFDAVRRTFSESP